MKTLYLSLALLISTLAGAQQYQFASKKAKKLYDKIDNAYMDEDYPTILKNESAIKSNFFGKEDTVAVNMYGFLAEAYYLEEGDLQKALSLYEKEYSLRKKTAPNPEELSNSLASLTNVQTELGMYSKAEKSYKQMLKYDEKAHGKKSSEYFNTGIGLVEMYYQTEQGDKGLAVLKDLQKSMGKDPVNKAIYASATANCYEVKGDFSKAKRYYNDAISTFEKNGLEATSEYVSTLNSLALLYTNKGELPKAEETFDQALSMVDRMKGDNEDLRAGVNGNLAQVYELMGNYKKAIPMQRSVLKEEKEIYGDDSYYTALNSMTLGLTLLKAKKYTESEKLLQDALLLLEKNDSKESVDFGRTLNNLSRLYGEQGKGQLAVEYGQKATQAYKSTLGENHHETAFGHYNLANAFLGSEKLQDAEKHITRAYQIRRKKLGKNHPNFAVSARQMAIYEWKRKNKKAALGYYKEAFDNYFTQINSFFPVLTEDEKAKFYYTNVKPTFEQYISFVVEYANQDPSLIGDIYNYQLSLKGLILYATKKVRASILASNDNTLIEQYNTWISQKEQLSKLFSANDLDVDIRNKKIDSLTVASDKLEKDLSASSEVFSKNFANTNITWKDVQGKLKTGEAAVEIVRFRKFSNKSAGAFTDDVNYAALVVTSETKGNPQFVVIENGKKLESRYLSNYRNAIRYQVNENYSYKLFWKPIAAKLDGVKKIYFSPDGVYNQISIYTLRNPKTKDYLINEIDLQLVTNTKDLLAFNEKSVPTGNVFFGYPNYNMGLKESQINQKENETRGMRGARGAKAQGDEKFDPSTVVTRGVRGNLLRYMQSTNSLAMLPGTKREVETMEDLYKKKNKDVNVFLNNEALETKIKEQKNPGTLHIATHGFFLEADPDTKNADNYVENPLLRSGLIMAGANSFIKTGALAKQHAGDDGILTAYEAMNLNLDKTEIVVLSACETGLGEVKNGEGVYGLQRAFQVAGAEAIIMSMWSVDDNATQELMTNFYDRWLSTGDKHTAFIEAQKKVKEKYKKPFYWGAFVMIGN